MDNLEDKKIIEHIDKIEWLGKDGLLVMAYFVVCAVIFSSIYYKIDVLIMYAFPFTLLGIVWVVFINYVLTLLDFFKGQKNKSR